MKRITLIIFLISALFCGVQAQNRPTISTQDREKWLSELRSYKHEFLTKELNLTKEQQNAFFAVYDDMDDELTRIANETRELENKVNASSSDTEILAATRALFEQKSREGAVELAYYEKIKDTITPKQLLRLKNAERKFTQQLVRHHGRSKAEGPKRKQ